MFVQILTNWVEKTAECVLFMEHKAISHLIESGNSMPDSQGLSNNQSILSRTNPVPNIDTYFFFIIHSNITDPSCHLPVSCRSLVDGVAPLGAVSHRFNFLI